MRGRGWIDALFRQALRMLPGWFRDRYADEMLSNFRAQRVDARRRSAVAGALYVLKAFVELPAAAARLRRAPPQAREGATGGGWVDDLRHAARSLRRSPGWTAAALVILTLGIGGTTAVFSVLHAVLLRPLPFEDPETLVSLWTVNTVQDLPDGSSWENGTDWLDRGRSLADVAFVFRPEFTSSTVTGFGEPERIHVGWVSANFFSILGVDAVAGRTFGPGDELEDTRLVVIGEGLWGARFGYAPETIGQTLTIDGEEYRIVGVVREELAIPLRETQVWRLQDVRTPEGRDWRGFDAYWVIGRLRPGVTVEAARRDLAGVAAELAASYPETNRNRSVSIRSLRSEIVGDDLPVLLWTLLGSMALVLLIGGTNVAQLLLGRGLSRRSEMAVMTALGATRTRVNRGLMLESALLSAMAALAGLMLAQLGLEGLLAVIPPDVPLLETVRIDRAVLAMAVLVTAVLAPLVGILPALASSGVDAADVLRTSGRSVTAGNRRTRSALVVAEIAMAVVLLGGAGLLVRSALALRAVDPGFEAAEVLIARVDLSPVDEGESHYAVHQELVARLAAAPGIRGVGTISQFFIERFPDQTIKLVGEAAREPGTPAPRLTTDQVSPGFFEAMGVPLLRGRPLVVADIRDANRPEIVVVNQTWVDTFSPDRDPVGRQFRWGDQVEGDAITVVGVVGDLRRTRLDEISYPQMFVAGGGARADLMVRTAGDPGEQSASVRRVVRAVDAGAAVSQVSTASERYDVGLSSRRFQTSMLAAFAALATALAAIGIFTIVHESVASRRREIGIRLALGAAPGEVRMMVVRQGMHLTLLGLTIGVGSFFLLSDVTSGMVYGVRSRDPLTLGAVALTLFAVSLAASAVPTLRSTRISPAETLCEE